MPGASAPFYNLKGGMNLQDSDFNLQQKQDMVFWKESKNVEINKRGGVSKMLGNEAVVNFTNGLKVLGLHDYKHEDGRTAIAVYSDATEGHICEVDFLTGTYEVVYSGLDKDAQCYFSTFVNAVIVTNGVDDGVIYEKDGFPKIRHMGLKRVYGKAAKYTIPYKGRLVASAESALYFSGAGLPTKWSDDANDVDPDTLYIPEFHNSTGYITGMAIYGDKLALYRESEVHVLTGSAPTGDDGFVIYPFGDKGSYSNRGIVNFDNNQYFFDDGFFNLQYNQLHNIELSSERSILIHPAFDEINYNRLDEIIAIGYPRRNQIWFFMPIDDVDDLSKIWILDLKNPRQPAWYSREATNIQCAFVFERDIYTGARAAESKPARILKENSTTTLEGVPFQGVWFSQYISLNESRPKVVQHMYIAWDGDRTNLNTDVVFRYNGNNGIEVKTIGGATIHNFFKVDDSLCDNDNFIVGNIGNALEKVRVPMEFTTISIGLRSYDDFAIDGFTLMDVSVRRA